MENINIISLLIYSGIIIAVLGIVLRFFTFLINLILTSVVLIGLYYAISGKSVEQIKQEVYQAKDRIVILLKDLNKEIDDISKKAN